MARPLHRQFSDSLVDVAKGKHRALQLALVIIWKVESRHERDPELEASLWRSLARTLISMRLDLQLAKAIAVELTRTSRTKSDFSLAHDAFVALEDPQGAAEFTRLTEMTPTSEAEQRTAEGVRAALGRRRQPP
jgi:hypothetical protein